MKKILTGYVPVLHQGYMNLFRKYAGVVDEIAIFGQDVIKRFDYLRKDIRAIEPQEMRAIIKELRLFKQVSIIDRQLSELAAEKDNLLLIMPDEDVSRDFVLTCLPNAFVSFDDTFFLLWNRNNANLPKLVLPDRTISVTDFDQEIMRRAFDEAKRSADFWLQIGAIIVRDGEVLMTAINKHVPSPRMHYTDGDPRGLFTKGVSVEISPAHHAERRLIAEAARKGIPLEGTSLYVTVFPCPPCAKDVAYAGIKRCYFASGYSLVDGQSILEAERVEIVQVEGLAQM